MFGGLRGLTVVALLTLKYGETMWRVQRTAAGAGATAAYSLLTELTMGWTTANFKNLSIAVKKHFPSAEKC